MKKSSRSLWLAFVFFVGVIFVFDVKGIEFYLVPSNSMEPTLKRSDYIIGFRLEPSKLQRGDIVVFGSGHKGDFYVKRVVGLPGETLAIVNGFVYINGHQLDEPYVQHRGRENLSQLKVPEDRVFLMGDNRTGSFDSRWFGPVSPNLVEARVSFIYNPIGRMGRVR
ncbi:MAG: signal peptidase I [Candidatus Hydrogenedentota bacterium]|nr:MAG: signal peptidase I [Candidatus Hydrogenedentota bacterium]